MKYIFGNWKMYLNLKDSVDLAEKLGQQEFDFNKINLGVFSTALAFAEVQKKLPEDIKIGAQNVSWTPQGAYTGAISAWLFEEAGAKYALVGHSERRYIFGETNDIIRKKVEGCLEVGLVPVLCVGETAEDKAENKREYRLKKQLMKVFEDLDLVGKKIMIAYEPVWAISKGGQGEACLPADADDVMGWIKSELKQYTDQGISVLYGGSVDAGNVVSYVSLDTCDGVLVGSASTKEEEFINLIKEVEKSLS